MPDLKEEGIILVFEDVMRLVGIETLEDQNDLEIC